MESPQSSLFGLVLAPTRELAYQIGQAFEALGSLISVKVAVVVGGMDMVSQAIALGKKPHIVVAVGAIPSSPIPSQMNNRAETRLDPRAPSGPP